MACLIIVSLQVLESDLELDKILKKYLENFCKIFESKNFYDISQSAAPSKHHRSYGKSFKKFVGGVVGWWPV